MISARRSSRTVATDSASGRPEVLLPPLRQRQDAAQHLLERQPRGDVRLVVGQLDRRGIRRRCGRRRAPPGELGGRRLGVRLEQQVDRVVGLAAVLQPDVGHDRRVLGEALELLGAEDPRPQVLELELHAVKQTGRARDGVKRRPARRSRSCTARRVRRTTGASTTTGSASSRRVCEVVAGRDLAERDEDDPQDALMADDHRVLVGRERVGGRGACALERCRQRLHAGDGRAERVRAPGLEGGAEPAPARPRGRGPRTGRSRPRSAARRR